MFDRIVKLGNPGAQRTYQGTYLGKSEWDLATIGEGQELVQYLSKHSADVRGGLGFPEARLVALDSAKQQAEFVPVEEMIEAGFPTKTPIHLYLITEQGAPRKTEDDPGDSRLFPIKTVGGAMVEVRDAAYTVATDKTEGLNRVFRELRLIG